LRTDPATSPHGTQNPAHNPALAAPIPNSRKPAIQIHSRLTATKQQAFSHSLGQNQTNGGIAREIRTWG